jgi:hypothetical protein
VQSVVRKGGDLSAGTIKLPIINYLEKQLMTVKVDVNDSFPRKVRDEDHDLQEIG